MQYGAASVAWCLTTTVAGAGEKATVNGGVKHVAVFQLLWLNGVKPFFMLYCDRLYRFL